MSAQLVGFVRQGHVPDAHQFLSCHFSVRGFVYLLQVLIASLRPDRNDQPAAGRELIDQSLGEGGSSSPNVSGTLKESIFVKI